MSDYNTIQEYLSIAEEQIRWKRARPVLSRELRQHLEDQRDAFAAEGFEDAERMAVEEMGSPVEVGAELDRIHRPRPQWGLLGMTVILAMIGGFLRVYLTAGYHFFAVSPGKTVLALLLGISALLGGYFLDCSRLLCRPKTVYITVLAVSVSYLFISYYLSYPFGLTKMYYAGYFTQLYPVIYAVWLYNWRGRGWKGFLLAAAGGIPLTAICMACVWSSLINTLILMVSGWMLLLFAVRRDWFRVSKPPAAACLVGIVLIFVSWVLLRYNPEQLTEVFHPERFQSRLGFIADNIRDVLETSQWLGKASADDIPSYFEGGVMEAYNRNLMLTAVVYQFGWLPFLMLVTATMGLLAWITGKCLRQKAGNLLVLSVVITFVCRSFFCVMLNMGVMLVSAEFPLLTGNLQSMVDMGLIGLALSVFRGGSVLRESEPNYSLWKTGSRC